MKHKSIDQQAFEQWYVENTFDLARSPLGSRDCYMQRRAWEAAMKFRDGTLDIAFDATPERQSLGNGVFIDKEQLEQHLHQGHRSGKTQSMADSRLKLVTGAFAASFHPLVSAFKGR
jgi:hypothetical protein